MGLMHSFQVRDYEHDWKINPQHPPIVSYELVFEALCYSVSRSSKTWIVLCLYSKGVNPFHKMNTKRLKAPILGKQICYKMKIPTKNQRFHFCARWMSKSCTKCAKFDIPLKNDATSVYCNFKFFINWGSFGILHCFMISHVSNLSILLLVLVILILIWIINSFKKKDESFFLDWRSLKKS